MAQAGPDASWEAKQDPARSVCGWETTDSTPMIPHWWLDGDPYSPGLRSSWVAKRVLEWSTLFVLRGGKRDELTLPPLPPPQSPAQTEGAAGGGPHTGRWEQAQPSCGTSEGETSPGCVYAALAIGGEEGGLQFTATRCPVLGRREFGGVLITEGTTPAAEGLPTCAGFVEQGARWRGPGDPNSLVVAFPELEGPRVGHEEDGAAQQGCQRGREDGSQRSLHKQHGRVCRGGGQGNNRGGGSPPCTPTGRTGTLHWQKPSDTRET